MPTDQLDIAALAKAEDKRAAYMVILKFKGNL
jgi:hypothetical protein